MNQQEGRHQKQSLYQVRELKTDDNLSLLELTNRCPLERPARPPFRGTSVLEIHRSPDYFAFVRSLRGKAAVLGVHHHGAVIAAATVVRREVSWKGEPVTANYVCDLKVHPEHRNTFVAARLMGEVRRYCGESASTYVYVREGSPVAGGLLRAKAGLRQYRQRDQIQHLVFPTMVPSFTSLRTEVLDMTTDRVTEWREYYIENRFSKDLVTLPSPQSAKGERRYGVIRNGRMVAAGSLLEQSRIRRLLITKLSPLDRLSHWAINSFAWSLRRQRFPGLGQEVRRAYLGDLLWKPGEGEAVIGLVSHCRRFLGGQGIHLLYVGLSHRERILPAVRKSALNHQFSSLLLTSCFPSPVQDQPTCANLHEM